MDRMEKKVKSVEVIVSAYNEEANIIPFIESILNQKGDNFIIKKINIASDGSNDNTTEKIKPYLKNKLINFKPFKDRKGKAFRLNQLLREFDSDILIMCDADVIFEKYAFTKIIGGFTNERVGLCCGNIKPIQPKTFIENVSNTGSLLWEDVRKTMTKEREIRYRCIGRFYAISSEVAKKIIYPLNREDDSFAFYFCVACGYQPRYIPEAYVIYKLANNFSDYFKQLTRYKLLVVSKYFNQNLIKRFEGTPFKIKIKVITKFLLSKPVYTLTYIFLQIASTYYSKFKKPTSLWPMSPSTKKVT